MTFKELGDDYGVDLAQRNLASALSALPSCEEEAEQLIRAIEERVCDEPDARRQRAWLCNILTRRLRRAGRYEEAETLAKEAIDIGATLGDEALRAINFVNLGNVYRDQERAKLAIDAYEAAAVSAQKCGRRDVEADASRLVAGIFNDFSKIEGSDDRHSRARVYAQYAIGLLRGALNYDALACSYVELGEAQEALGESVSATESFFEAAQAFAQVPDEDNYGRALVRACRLALPDHVDLYVERLADALGVDRPNSDEALADKFITLVRPLIDHSPREALIPLLGGHLYQVWSHLPGVLQGALVSAVTNIVRETARNHNNRSDSWRVLYAGVVLSYLLKDRSQPFLNARLAQSIVHSVEDVFVREEGDDSRIWTVVMNLGRRVTISILSLDKTPETNLASFALAMFIKAFEDELDRELIGGEAGVDELMIYIGHIDHMPEDVRHLADQNLGLGGVLAEQACVVSRPSDFKETMPTFVLLSATFFERIVFGEGRGGSLQMLFGFTFVELTFQLLRGEVEMEAIRPKVISLVSRTMS
jgi:tetratricopeptide (TPR) repeat protein